MVISHSQKGVADQAFARSAIHSEHINFSIRAVSSERNIKAKKVRECH
jgi:hypothetical protein